MIVPYLQSRFITRILTSPTGEKFEVIFLVHFVDGKFQAQVVSAKPISESREKPSACLPSCKISSEDNFSYFPAFYPIISPFKDLLFFTSQPTRAPAFVK